MHVLLTWDGDIFIKLNVVGRSGGLEWDGKVAGILREMCFSSGSIHKAMEMISANGVTKYTTLLGVLLTVVGEPIPQCIYCHPRAWVVSSIVGCINLFVAR